MWNGKNKAVTFSFDDGVTQDLRLIELLDKYGLKATFNLNSSLLGLTKDVVRNERTVSHNKVDPYKVKEIYKNHEVAVHTLTHPNLTGLSDDAVIWQVEEDRKALEGLVGYDVRCMAYPCGGVNNDDRVAEIIKKNTKIRFARTITPSYSFDPQDNLFRFNPSVYYIEIDKMFEMGREFIEIKPDAPKLFYIWGHSYEMDAEYITWEKFEEFCKLISGHDDIFYGTNSQVLFN
ncbi:MAG: polysaccharide deacetylase family protein [Clostridia bacterium]|nr:polysaccharide deacetylase family protein [Clostridia bacterium]